MESRPIRQSFALSLLGLLIAGSFALAESPGLDLAAQIDFARQHFSQSDTADVQRAWERLLSASRRMDEYLRRAGETGQRWRQFIHWRLLNSQLALGGDADLNELASVYGRLASDHRGLSRPKFNNVRLAIRDVIQKRQDAATRDARQHFDEQLDLLAEAVADYPSANEKELRQRIVEQLNWLDARGYASNVTSAVRRYFSCPNLILYASRDFIASGIDRQIVNTAPVRDYILGTSIHGTGRTRGRMTVSLESSDDRAVLNLDFRGATNTNSIGYNGPVQLHTQGTTQWTARKRLAVDVDGIRTQPTRSSARTDSYMDGIATPFRGFANRVVTRAATRRYHQQKSAAEQIAARHAEARLNARIDQRLDPLLRDADRRYQQAVRNPLLWKDSFPRNVRLDTSPNGIRLMALETGRAQLGAPTPPPAMVDNPELLVSMHESVINNVCGALLAGTTLSQELVQLQLAALLGLGEPSTPDSTVPDSTVPDAKMPDSTTEELFITFADHMPVVVGIDDNLVTIELRGTEFHYGEEVLPAMNITIRYQLEKIPGGLRATLYDSPAITPPRSVESSAGGNMTPDETELRDILSRRLADVLPPRSDNVGTILPGPWKDVGTLLISEYHADDGWLSVAWENDVGHLPIPDSGPAPQQTPLAEASPVPELRTWTDRRGRRSRARLSEVHGERLIFVAENGRFAEARLAQLSVGDRAYVRQWSAARRGHQPK